ncbi:C69 family dipeptidase [Lactovum miscens]|uniref:Dipeptidase n=1 Tax=Lactovum miscens TaxID=190387 RepID=A0A841C962_9LACT|nr:C69 family dipeptidase [Lactovum miscens]MBB5887929.1 dipeptidase [Lactovum miscens]
MLKPYRASSCTTILVGKNASINGATIISRNEDGSDTLNPQRFVLIKPTEQMRHYKAIISGCEFDLPDNPQAYTSMPDANTEFGIWAAAGINSSNVAMSATETITTNSRIQGLDPYNDGGLGEEDLVTVTLPYIHSAREGVERLGKLIAEYGTYEPNGIAFSDRDEVWWFESIGGHHWAAVRIPDDAYVVAPNRFNIDHFNFDSNNTLCSSDLKKLIDDNNLNPDFEGYNLRHIFGSSSIKDTVYNNPRTWYGQKFFNPEVEFEHDYMDQDFEFIMRANRKITIEDIKFILSSHYENTEFDPYSKLNTEAERHAIRPIGLNRNMNVHILEIRNDVDEQLAGVHWVGFGANTFNFIVPFYSQVTDTPEAYRDTTTSYDPTKYYWLAASCGLLGDNDYDRAVDNYCNAELKAFSRFRLIQNETDKLGASGNLNSVNQKLSDIAMEMQTKLMGDMVISGTKHMTLKFSFAD